MIQRIPKVFVIALSVLFFSCGTRYVYFNTIRPADINLPSHLKTLVLVDRSEFDKQGWNIVEGIFTGELPGEDRAAAQYTLQRFSEIMSRSPRYQTKLSSRVLKGNSLTNALPEPLPWPTVDQLCMEHAADALVAIEVFDSDFITTNGKRRVKKTIDEKGVKKEIEVDEYWAEGVANLTIGFRIYDPKNRTIADQQVFTRTNRWQTTGTSLQDAISKLIQKAEATRYMGGLAGEAYAYKIAPLPVRVSRVFYSKSSKVTQVSLGARQGDVSDWEGAIRTWKSGLPIANRKDGGKLCHNIAVAFEVLGELDSAQAWAQKSFIEYGNKRSREYYSILQQRKWDEERLKQQMAE